MQQKLSIRTRLGMWLLGQNEPRATMPGISLDKYSAVGRMSSNTLSGNSKSLNMSGGVTFSVYSAAGGYVVETNYYNEQTDRHTQGLHIITDTEEFSTELGNAVLMAMLKR